MGIKVFISGLIIAAGIFSPTGVLAFNQRLTVYASIAQQRGIYINSSGLIIKVAGNTSNNVQPMVFNEAGQTVAMTEPIQSQYQAFLKAHDYHLQAGETYLLNPADRLSLTL